MNYPEQRNDAPPPRAPASDGEHWRRAGYELVQRLGSPVERAEAKARLKEVLAIRAITEKWMRNNAACAYRVSNSGENSI